MIKAVVFDFGNVICRFDNRIVLQKIAGLTGKTVEELNGLIYQSSTLVNEYEMGLIDSKQFFNRISLLCNLNVSKEEFVALYTNKFNPIWETFSLIEKLKLQYKLGLVSNTSEMDFEHGIKTTRVFTLFDAVTLSYQVHALKPSRQLYDDILRKLSVKPDECIYVDDILENAASATSLGMHGMQFTTSSQLENSLKRLGVG